MIADQQHPTQDQPTHRELVESLRQIILEETDNGRAIIKFLHSAMNGEFEDFQPCHQLDAARILQRLGLEEAQAFIDAATARRAQSSSSQRAEQREAQPADTRIRSELAQMVREETDNGRAIVTFLVQAMQGELQDFKPCHRMSASRQLIHRGFEYIPPDEDIVDDVVDRVEAARQLFAEERRRRRYEEAVEFSFHGPDYYSDRYPFFCPCEDRRHDCDGNELSEQECEEIASLPTGKSATITDSDELEAHIAGYNAYLTRINPGRDLALHFDSIRWPAIIHAAYHDP